MALAVFRETHYQWLAPDVGPVKYLNDQDILYEMDSYNLVEPISEDINNDGIVNILDFGTGISKLSERQAKILQMLTQMGL